MWGTEENADLYRRIRILVVGPSGAGKTTLCHFIANGRAPESTPKGTTVGCHPFVKMMRIDQEGRRVPESSAPDANSVCFAELIDVGGHPRYSGLRHVFYGNIHGLILVYDLTNPRYRSVVHRWATEVASAASFHPILPPDVAQSNLEGMPVPVLLVGNKADKHDKGEHKRASIGGAIESVFGSKIYQYLNKMVEWEEDLRSKVTGRSPILPVHNSGMTPHHSHHPSRSGSTHNLAMSVLSGTEIPGVQQSIKTSALTGNVDMNAIEDFLASVAARRFGAASYSVPSASAPSPWDGLGLGHLGMAGGQGNGGGGNPLVSRRMRESPNSSMTSHPGMGAGHSGFALPQQTNPMSGMGGSMPAAWRAPDRGGGSVTGGKGGMGGGGMGGGGRLDDDDDGFV